jgi:hypothetical protein
MTYAPDQRSATGNAGELGNNSRSFSYITGCAVVVVHPGERGLAQAAFVDHENRLTVIALPC